jgi:cell shape-determining protein MreC
MTSPDLSKEEIPNRLAVLEKENQQLRKRAEEVEELREENKRLRATFRLCEGPNTPPGSLGSGGRRTATY